ncbi:hypothetical protein ACFLRI_03245 [Bacteroidota bacterium]
MQLLTNLDINRQKWDYCVDNALRPAIYALSWYLDAVCPEWKGLVIGDYKAVMPVCWRKKAGQTYLFQPPYCQFGGIF